MDDVRWTSLTAIGTIGVGLEQWNAALHIVFLLASITGLIVNMVRKKEKKNGND